MRSLGGCAFAPGLCRVERSGAGEREQVEVGPAASGGLAPPLAVSVPSTHVHKHRTRGDSLPRLLARASAQPQ